MSTKHTDICRVYYKGTLLETFNMKTYKAFNKYYLYKDAYLAYDGLWFKADRTPVLIEDVPKELLAMELIQTCI